MRKEIKTKLTAMDIISIVIGEILLMSIVIFIWYMFLTEYPNTIYCVIGFVFGRISKYIPFKRLKL